MGRPSRHRRNRVSSAAILIVVAVTVSVLGVNHLRPKTSTVIAQAVDPSESPVESGDPIPEESKSPEPTPSPSPTESAEPPVCRNSTDPACGPFYWDPEPQNNQPLSLEVSVSPEQPRPGDPVVVTVHASDPDAPIKDTGVLSWGDHSSGIGAALWCRNSGESGPWTPVAEPGDHVSTFVHTFDTPGSFRVAVESISGPEQCATGAYESRARTAVVIVVEPNPSPSPTPTESPSPSPSPTPTIEPSETPNPENVRRRR